MGFVSDLKAYLLLEMGFVSDLTHGHSKPMRVFLDTTVQTRAVQCTIGITR